MQAADYRFVDVSGIEIADKIVPKTDGPEGGALPDRAEDVAFLYEAVNERGQTVTPSVEMLVREWREGMQSLGWYVRSSSCEPEQGAVGLGYWCDIGALGVLEDEEVTGRDFDPVALWPGMFPGRTVGTQFGRVVAMDEMRRMYRDLKRHEGYIRMGRGIAAAGTMSRYINGELAWTEPTEGIVGAEYRTSVDNGDTTREEWEIASLTVEAETGEVPPLGLGAATLALYIVTEGRQNAGSQMTTRRFVKVIDGPTAQKVNAAPRAAYGEAGFSEGWMWAEARIDGYCAICPFEGRTKLRDVAWNWEPR